MRSRILFGIVAAVAICLAGLWALWRSETPASSPAHDEARSVPREAPPAKEAGAPPTEPPAPEAAGPTLTISGSVLNAETDEPIEGARVVVTISASEEIARPVGEVTTDPDGRYCYRGDLPDGAQNPWLHAYKEGFAPARYKSLNWAARPREQGTFELEPIPLTPGKRVRGLVVRPEGDPSPPGEVIAFRKGPGSYPTWREIDVSPRAIPIEKDGSFVAWLDWDEAAFQANVPGFQPSLSAPTPVRADGSSEVFITLNPGVSVSSRVIDEEGKPVAGATIRIHPLPADRDPDRLFEKYTGSWSFTSDESGAFAFVLPGERLQGFQAGHPDYCPLTQLVSNLSEFPREIVLKRGRTITLRLAGPDGSPILARGLRIELDRGSQASLRHEGAGYRSTPLSPDTTGGMLKITGYASKRLEWPPGIGTHDVGTITIGRQNVLELVVRDEAGEPVEGAEIMLAGSEGGGIRTSTSATDAKGKWSFGGLPMGRVFVIVRKAGFILSDREVTIETDPTTIDVTLTAAGSVTARLLRPDGQPAHPGKAYPYDAEIARRGSPLPAVEADRDGRVRVIDLPLGKALTIVFEASGAAPLSRDLEPFSAGEERDLGDIVLERGFSIIGKVIDDAGNAVPDALVEPEGPFARPSGMTQPVMPQPTRSNAEGAFRLNDLAAGTYPVFAFKPGYNRGMAQEIRVVDGDVSGIELRLTKGIPYEGRVVFSDGTPARGAEVSVQASDAGVRPVPEGMGWSWAQTDTGGRFRIPAAPPGPVRLTVSRPGLREPIVVDAVSADALPKTIELPAPPVLEIRAAGGDPASPLIATITVTSEDGRRLPAQEKWPIAGGVLRIDHLASGVVSLLLECDGYRPISRKGITLSDGQTTVVEVALEPIGEADRAEIIARDREGNPIAGATCRPLESDGRRDRRDPVATDKDGRAIIEFLTSPEAGVRILKNGYAPLIVENARAHLRDGVLEAILDRESVFQIGITNPDGTPVAGMTPFLAGPGTMIGMEHARVSPSGEDGIAEIGNLAAGSYSIGFYRKEASLAPIQASIGVSETRRLSYVLPQPLVVSGIVRHNGAPVSGGKVMCARAGRDSGAAPVGADGRFRIEVARAGLYQVEYIGEGPQRLYFSTRTEIAEGKALEIDIETVDVEGRLVREDGRPLAGLRLGLQGLEEKVVATDAEGQFSIEAMRPGPYYWTILDPPAGLIPSGTVVLGGAGRLEIVVPAAGEIEFRLEGDLPKKRWWLRALSAQGENLYTEHPATAATGRARFPLGARALYVTSEDFRFGYAPLDRRSAGGSCTITMQVGGRVSFDLSVSAEEARGCEVTLSPQGAPPLPDCLRAIRFAESTREDRVLPPGGYTLKATLAGGRKYETSFTVEAEKSTRLTLAPE